MPLTPQSSTVRRVYRKAVLAVLLLALASVNTFDTAAQQADSLSPQAAAQIAAIVREKQLRTPTQRKIQPRLLHAARVARGDAVAPELRGLRTNLPGITAAGAVVDVSATVNATLLATVRALGGEVLNASAAHDHLRVRIPLARIEQLAQAPEVRFVAAEQPFVTHGVSAELPSVRVNDSPLGLFTRAAVRNSGPGTEHRPPFSPRAGWDNPVFSVGSRTSQGDATHRAAAARAAYAVTGAGVRVGVLFDGVSNLAASQGLGDLGAVTVLTGQAGDGDEGTAMLEIIHDLAPGADLYFATALGGPAVFAQNIRALQAAGCTIIVDDVRYISETPFQDGQVGSSTYSSSIVAKAVKDVANAGVLYFSSAGNSGNKNDGTSGTWEGDFVDGGDAAAPLDRRAGRLHQLRGVNYNSQHVAARLGDAPLAEPIGGVTSDYDVFILSATARLSSIIQVDDQPEDTQEAVE